jgi:hypothetical protein
MAKAPKKYIITCINESSSRTSKISTKALTLEEAIKHYDYTLLKGQSWQHEKGNKKINRNPKTIKGLLTNLINSENNAAQNGYAAKWYIAEEVTEPVAVL